MSKTKNDIFQKEFVIICDGVTVIGEVTQQTWFDVTVQIASPYEGLKKGVHIPFAAGGVKNFTGLNGMKKAEELLREIYVLCLEIEQKSADLKSGLDKFEIAEKARLRLIEASKKAKRNNLELYKNQEIDQQEYQKRMKAADKEGRDFEAAYCRQREAYLKTFLTGGFEGMEEQVVAYIRRLIRKRRLNQ